MNNYFQTDPDIKLKEYNKIYNKYIKYNKMRELLQTLKQVNSECGYQTTTF